MPKQFIELNGKPILRHTLEKFQTSPDIDDLFVILPADCAEQYDTIIRQEWIVTKLVRTIKGGAERHDSVAAGLQAVDESTDIIMIHDGVRPFVSHMILQDSINAANEHGAAVVGLMPKDKRFSTDDTALVEQMGYPVAVVEGEWRNIKITSPDDLVIAKAFLEADE